MTAVWSTAAEMAARVHAGETSAEALATSALARLDAVQPATNAFIDVWRDGALSRARAVDAKVRAGERPPLAGVPVAIKNNICVSPADGGGRTTCASRMLEQYRSPFTATAVCRLLGAGAVPIAGTNLDEFAMGSSNEHSAFGPVRNPWDLARVPGGSSGGSAVAVAAGVVPLALGSDTGGSIRQPAAMCGVVGLKPTYGRVSRYGLVAYASSLDQIGPITRDVRDAALCLSVLSGHDPLDATSASLPAPDLLADLERPPQDLKIGVPTQAMEGANHAGVASAFEAAIGALRSMGAQIVTIDLPMTDPGIAAYYIVAMAEASSNLARFDGVRYGRRATLAPGDGLEELYCKSRAEGFGPEVQRRIMLGTHVLSAGYYDAYYTTALRVRRRVKADFDSAFSQGCAVVAMPAAPNPAWRVGEKSGDPLAMYLEDVYTVGVNLAGLPAVSVPCGMASDGGARLPVGLQLVGPAFDEARLLRVARMFERSGVWAGGEPTMREDRDVG